MSKVYIFMKQNSSLSLYTIYSYYIIYRYIRIIIDVVVA